MPQIREVIVYLMHRKPKLLRKITGGSNGGQDSGKAGTLKRRAWDDTASVRQE